MGQFSKNYRTFYPKKLSLSCQKYGSGIRDPRSGKNLFRIPDPGVKKASDPGSATLITRPEGLVGTCEAGRRTLVTMYPTAKRPSFCWMYTRCDGRTVSGVGDCTPEVRYLACILSRSGSSLSVYFLLKEGKKKERKIVYFSRTA